MDPFNVVRSAGLSAILLYFTTFPSEMKSANLYTAFLLALATITASIISQIIVYGMATMDSPIANRVSILFATRPFKKRNLTKLPQNIAVSICTFPILSCGGKALLILTTDRFLSHFAPSSAPLIKGVALGLNALYFGAKYNMFLFSIICEGLFFILSMQLPLATVVVSQMISSALSIMLSTFEKRGDADKGTSLMAVNLAVPLVGFWCILAHFTHYSDQLSEFSLLVVLKYVVVMYTGLHLLEPSGMKLLGVFGIDVHMKGDNDYPVIKGILSGGYLAMLSCMAEEAFFIPLYIDNPILPKWQMAILAGSIFSAMHIMGRSPIVIIQYLPVTLIQLYLNHGMLNSMIGHYIYNASQLYLYQRHFGKI